MPEFESDIHRDCHGTFTRKLDPRDPIMERRLCFAELDRIIPRLERCGEAEFQIAQGIAQLMAIHAPQWRDWKITRR